MLNSNTENPYLIWDNATRGELNEFLETQQLRKIKTVMYWESIVLLRAYL